MALHPPRVASLPPELLLDIFLYVPFGERLPLSLVCRRWTPAAQVALWRHLEVSQTSAFHRLAVASRLRPDLPRTCHSYAFTPSDADYLSNLDMDLTFHLAEAMVSLRHYTFIAPNSSGEVFASVCALLSPELETCTLSSEEDLDRIHFQYPMLFPNLRLLSLRRLRDLELEILELEWEPPRSLTELVLIQPDLSDEEFEFVVRSTKNTLRTLRIDMGSHTYPEDTLTSEIGVTQALLNHGDQLHVLDVMWPYVKTPILDEAVKGCRNLKYVAVGGRVCTTLMDRHCPPTLRGMDVYVPIGYPAAIFESLWKPGYRISNVTKYVIITRTKEPLDKMEIEWTDQARKDWAQAANDLDKCGINMTGDFF